MVEFQKRQVLGDQKIPLKQEVTTGEIHVKKIVDALPTRASSATFLNAIVAATATLIIASNINRKACVIINISSVTVFLGGSGVTLTTGLPIAPGERYSNDIFTGAIYGIVASGTANVRFEEDE